MDRWYSAAAVARWQNRMIVVLCSGVVWTEGRGVGIRCVRIIYHRQMLSSGARPKYNVQIHPRSSPSGCCSSQSHRIPIYRTSDDAMKLWLSYSLPLIPHLFIRDKEWDRESGRQGPSNRFIAYDLITPLSSTSHVGLIVIPLLCPSLDLQFNLLIRPRCFLGHFHLLLWVISWIY